MEKKRLEYGLNRSHTLRVLEESSNGNTYSTIEIVAGSPSVEIVRLEVTISESGLVQIGGTWAEYLKRRGEDMPR